MRAPSEVRPAVFYALNRESQTVAEIAGRVYFSTQAVRLALREFHASGEVVRERIEPTGGRPPYGWKRRG